MSEVVNYNLIPFIDLVKYFDLLEFCTDPEVE